MQHQYRDPGFRIAIIAMALMTVGLSCQWLSEDLVAATPTGEPPAGEISPTGEPPAEPPAEPAEPTDTPISPPESRTLNAEGPWLLIETSGGLWAANPDGTGITQLTEVDYWLENLEWAVRPGGNQIAFITPLKSLDGMALNLLSLPGGEVTRITDLTSPETSAYADLDPGEPGFDALRAVEYSRLAWSPDGARLAFTGLMDGPSAEVYIYTFASGEITRVSRDDSQNYDPFWSPDGAHLLYFGTEAFGTGAGYDVTGVWSANGDGTGAARLYVPEGGIEELIGWLDDTTAVMDIWSAFCGKRSLRLFDILTRETVMLEEDCFFSTAVNDRRGEVLYANEDGLYLLTAGDPEPVLVSQDAIGRIDPVGPDDTLFTVRLNGGGLATFGGSELDHQVSPVKAPVGKMYVAVYGAIWAWTSADAEQPGAWVTGPGMEIGQIYPGKAVAPIWDERNNLLFFAPWDGGGYSLNRATFANSYKDVGLIENFEASSIQSVAWLRAP